MGLFSSNKSNTPSYSDKVWKTRNWAIKGLVREALLMLTKKEQPIVITFFPDTKLEVMNFLQDNQVPHRVLETGNMQGEPNGANVLVADADLMNTSEWVSLIVTLLRSSKLGFLFAGHYPLPSIEDGVFSKLTAGQSTKTKITFFLSLEDPLLKAFGSDRLQPLLQTLGLKDEECIEHSMVSKSIQRAQEKLQEAVQRETKTQSEEDWFERNYKKQGA